MTDPVLVTKCGHTFDRSCIEDWLTNKKTCPTCNHAMQQSVSEQLSQHYSTCKLLRLVGLFIIGFGSQFAGGANY
jgi:SUMO ligase MMS21 Smc5/6 complex component